MRAPLTIVAAAVVLAGSFVLGRETATPRVVTERVIERISSPAAPAVQGTAELHAAVRAALDERAPVACVPAPRQPEVDRDESALAAARDALAETTGDGHWSEEDRDRMLREMTRLSRDGAAEITGTLMPLLASGSLKIDFEGPPL